MKAAPAAAATPAVAAAATAATCSSKTISSVVSREYEESVALSQVCRSLFHIRQCGYALETWKSKFDR